VRLRYLALAFVWTAFIHAQSNDVAKTVYKNAEGAVFLVYVDDLNGTPNALGSAFLIAPRELITNAHVVEGGSPVLAVGPARIPLKIVRIDHTKDLALLSVDADLTSTPLKLATGSVSPGEAIYAIGNPDGLEKTLSAGIVSALRVQEGRQLIQITSPISHGSSGGPILNSDSEVVGVAVGMMEDGQNLNFAVPVADVRAIIAGDTSTVTTVTDISNAINALNDLLLKKQKAQYSDDPNSEYQQDRANLISSMKVAVSASATPNQLRQLSCIGVKDLDLSDEGIRAAQELVQNTSSLDDQALLA
jgi:hypothetical protein